MITTNLWTLYQQLDDALQLKVLLFAGREAAASFRIACGKEETYPKEVGIAEQAVLYEPFAYWDWQEQDASFRAAQRNEGGSIGSLVVEDRKRKRRLLWERERAFRVKGEWHEYPLPQERWEAFKRGLEKKHQNRKHVKRIAVASWMKAADMKWIAQNLPRLIGLDLSNVPERGEPTSGSSCHSGSKAASWIDYLATLHIISREPKVFGLQHVGLFTYLKDPSHEEASEYLEELARAEDFIKMNENGFHNYRRPDPQHEKNENFEEFFWRLLQEERDYKARTGGIPSEELRRLEETITESRLCMKLKWLAVRDWRLKPDSEHVCRLIQRCTSLTTLSIRGHYDRDYTSIELPSIHDHVCVFVGGVINTVPNTVKTIELRLSLSFIRFFLEQLHKHKPSVERVGIDLGAWMHVYPLRNQARTLKDSDVRNKAVAVARQKRFDVYAEEHDKAMPKGSIWHLPDKESSVENDDYRNDQIYRNKQRNVYRDISGTVVQINPEVPARASKQGGTSSQFALRGIEGYDFFGEQPRIDGEPQCPLAHCTHDEIARCLDDTAVDTLPKMLKKLHLARCVGEDLDADRKHETIVAEGGKEPHGFRVSRRGAKLFALDPEQEERSYDPIHPLTAFQLSSSTELKSGVILSDWQIADPVLLYAWLERTFKWRPVLDWDWFMVPEQMAKTADPDLIHIASESDWRPSLSFENPEENELTRTLRGIATQLRHMRQAGTPVHLLIGRRSPDYSSCYWGWPHNERGWERWKDEDFSANLEMIAPHIDVLSIMYDLRNPLDSDHLSEFEDSTDRAGTRAMCPLRKCPWKEAADGSCPFEDSATIQHPRPQVNSTVVPVSEALHQKMANKRKLKRRGDTPKGYGSLDNGSSGRIPPGENANDHLSDDSEQASEARLSSRRIAKRAIFTREALGWQRFWNKYALHFKSLTVLRVRMPRDFDKIGSWRLAKLLTPNVGWGMITYTDERQHMQTHEDLVCTLSRDFADSYEIKPESRVWPAGRFVRRTWVWDNTIVGSDDGFKQLDATKRQILHQNGPPMFPRIYLEPDFIQRPYWADRHFESSDWETTEDGEKEEFAKAVKRAQDATSYEHSYAQQVDMQSRASAAGGKPEIQFSGKYGHHISHIAGGQWRSELRSLEAGLQHYPQEVLRNVAESLLKTVSERPPYDAIFCVADDDDIHPVSGLQWENKIVLQSGTVDRVIEEERKRRSRPHRQPDYSSCTSPESDDYAVAEIDDNAILCLDPDEDVSNEDRNTFFEAVAAAPPQTKSAAMVPKPKRTLPFLDCSSEDEEDSKQNEGSLKTTDTEEAPIASGVKPAVPTEGGGQIMKGLGIASHDAASSDSQPVTRVELNAPAEAHKIETNDTKSTSKTRKRKAPTPAPSEPVIISEEAEGPVKRAKTAQRTTRKSPVYSVLPPDGEGEEAEDHKECPPKKKRPAKRSGSTASFQPSAKIGDDADDDSEDDFPPTKGRGRSRASKSNTPDSRRRAKTASSTRSKGRAGTGDDSSAVDDALTEGGSIDYSKLTVVKLKELLKEKGAKLTGMTRKAQFVAKLADLEKESGNIGN